MKIINWLTVPTATANLVNAVGGLFFPVNFYAVLEVARIVGVAIIAISLPLLWWRFSARRPRGADRHRAGDARGGAVRSRGAPPLVLHVAVGHRVGAGAEQDAIAAIAGFSTWIMVIFKPDGSHGMYSWLHVTLATACAVVAWYYLAKHRTPPSDAISA